MEAGEDGWVGVHFVACWERTHTEATLSQVHTVVGYPYEIDIPTFSILCAGGGGGDQLWCQPPLWDGMPMWHFFYPFKARCEWHACSETPCLLRCSRERCPARDAPGGLACVATLQLAAAAPPAAAFALPGPRYEPLPAIPGASPPRARGASRAHPHRHQVTREPLLPNDAAAFAGAATGAAAGVVDATGGGARGQGEGVEDGPAAEGGDDDHGGRWATASGRYRMLVQEAQVCYRMPHALTIALPSL